MAIITPMVFNFPFKNLPVSPFGAHLHPSEFWDFVIIFPFENQLILVYFSCIAHVDIFLNMSGPSHSEFRHLDRWN